MGTFRKGKEEIMGEGKVLFIIVCVGYVISVYFSGNHCRELFIEGALEDQTRFASK